MADDGYFDKQARPQIRAALDRLAEGMDPTVFIRTVAYVLGEIVAEHAAGDMERQIKLDNTIVNWLTNAQNHVNKKRPG